MRGSVTSVDADVCSESDSVFRPARAAGTGEHASSKHGRSSPSHQLMRLHVVLVLGAVGAEPAVVQGGAVLQRGRGLFGR